MASVTLVGPGVVFTSVTPGPLPGAFTSATRLLAFQGPKQLLPGSSLLLHSVEWSQHFPHFHCSFTVLQAFIWESQQLFLLGIWDLPSPFLVFFKTVKSKRENMCAFSTKTSNWNYVYGLHVFSLQVYAYYVICVCLCITCDMFSVSGGHN